MLVIFVVKFDVQLLIFFLLGARELRLTSSFATSLRSAQRQQRLFKTVKIETGLLEN
jgi:hypothetical protein